MRKIFLEDLREQTEKEIKEHIANTYSNGDRDKILKDIKRFNILIAFETIGDFGYDSSSFFLIKDKKTGKLYENHASHCSCYGFEGQWAPEETTIEYLKSDKFRFISNSHDNNQKIREFIKRMRK